MLGLLPPPSVRPDPEPEPEAQLQAQGRLRAQHSLDCEAGVLSCRFNQTGLLLAVGLMNGNIKLYKPSTGAFVYILRDSETLNSTSPVTSLSFCPQEARLGDLLLATYASGKVKLWHVSTQRCLYTVVEDQETLTAAFNPSGTRFATAGSAASIRLYDTNSRDCLLTLTSSPSPTVMDGHRSRVFALKFHPTSLSELISGGWDNTVQFWTENHPHSIRKIYGPHLCGDALQIHPETNQILTGSWRRGNSLQVWDYTSGEKIHDIPEDDGDHSLIYSCHWLGSDHLIAAGTRSNICRLVERDSMSTVGRVVNLPRGVYSTDVTGGGLGMPLIAVCSQDHVHLLEQLQC